jgi:hypothetical protein
MKIIHEKTYKRNSSSKGMTRDNNSVNVYPYIENVFTHEFKILSILIHTTQWKLKKKSQSVVPKFSQILLLKHYIRTNITYTRILILDLLLKQILHQSAVSILTSSELL